MSSSRVARPAVTHRVQSKTCRVQSTQAPRPVALLSPASALPRLRAHVHRTRVHPAMRPQALIVASKLARSAAHVMRAPCACSKNTDATVRHFHAQMHDAIIAGGPARSHAPCAKQNVPQLGCVLGQEKTERPHSPKRFLFLPRWIRIQVSDQRWSHGGPSRQIQLPDLEHQGPWTGSRWLVVSG